MDKRNQGRFCIQFNTIDARHLQVIEILEAHGRRKAQFITEAVLHFINCKETSDIGMRQDPTLFKKTVEAIVRECVKKEVAFSIVDFGKEEILPPSEESIPQDESNYLFESSDEIDEDLFTSIRETISAFRDNEL